MAGIGDLLRLSGGMPAAGPGGDSGLMTSLAVASQALNQMARNLDVIRMQGSPALTYHPIVVNNTPDTFLGQRDFGPINFISRWVDVYMGPSSAAGFFISFYDENFQVPGQEMLMGPGEFRSFSIASRGVRIRTVNINTFFYVTFWGGYADHP